MIDFKYTTKDKVENFIFNLHENEDCECPIEFLKGNKELMRLIYSRGTQLSSEQVLGIVETFLHLFENSEDYELCASLIKTWPELKR